MLTENTGRHMGDSGDAYGRNWERNQFKTIEMFDAEPEETLTLWGGDIERTVSVFHFLSQLELDEVCEDFNRVNDMAKDWDADAEVYGVSRYAWGQLCEALPDLTIVQGFNTYNGDCSLSQTLQGSWIDCGTEYGEPYYILLQVHGGCDVRGGYTNAKLFRVREPWHIHEYLREYVDSYDLKEQYESVEPEYAPEFTDEDNGFTYSSEYSHYLFWLLNATTSELKDGYQNWGQ